VSQDARARPLAERAAFEAQIPTEVLRQDQSRSAVHHERGAASGDADSTVVYLGPKRRLGRARIAEAQ
jgi:hypothetical protein